MRSTSRESVDGLLERLGMERSAVPGDFVDDEGVLAVLLLLLEAERLGVEGSSSPRRDSLLDDARLSLPLERLGVESNSSSSF